MHNVTTLAVGQVTTSDELRVELVQSLELRPSIVIRWPAAPTVTDLGQFAAAANIVARLMAAAVTRLAELRRQRKLF
jgi:hypothetical protein